ncbi:MAG: GWxTD domain-containing protein [Candidatus Eisenbacteria bacterium]
MMAGTPRVARSVLAAALLLLAGGGPASAGGDPVQASGEIRFIVDRASFLRGAAVLEEIYLLIPSKDLRFESPEGNAPPESEIRVRFRFRRWPTGEPILDRRMDALLPGPAPGGGEAPDLQILTHAFELPEGPYRLEVEVEDRKSRGMGFFYLFGRAAKKGNAVCFYRAKEFDPNGLDLSDIQFSRAIEEDREGTFAKGSWDVTPQPNRLFGVLMPELSFYYEIYDHAERRDPGGEPYRVRHEILDADDRVAVEEEQALSARGRGSLFRRTGAMDLTGLPAGAYRLRVTVESPERGEKALAEGAFEVAWRAADFIARSSGGEETEPAWEFGDRAGDDLVEEMRMLLGRGELDKLKRLGHEERRAWVEEYWTDRDPTPGTPVNELREEHYRRIRLANTRFRSIRLKGIETDRGRVYVRYGEPDEIRTAFADQSFVPGSRIFPGSRSVIGEEGRERGGINVSEKQYEVWTYNERGRILGDQHKVASGLGMRFVFVDVEGYGNFRIVESSELSDY